MNTTKKVFYVLILIFVLTIFLFGCSFLNPNDSVLSYDIFINTVKTLNTPQKVCNYMEDNFTYFCDPNKPILTPYELYLIKIGDCDDFSNFASFAVNYHNYPSYQVHIYFKGSFVYHSLAVYLENDKYTYSSNAKYFPIYASNFNDIILDYFKYDERELNYYEIYDYSMNLIEKNYASW